MADKMNTFRITFRRFRGSPLNAQLIEARYVAQAIRKLGPVWSIRSISMQCAGLTSKGNPCQRFTSNEYCCESHRENWEVL
jgi:hypothetical protein